LKLFIQIPCLNESQTLPLTFADLPKKIRGISEIKVLVIDDGSSDDTVNVAKRLGIKDIVIHKTNQGLARAFKSGLDYCIKNGADIIVNTDADNQYKGSDIAKIVNPIIENKADIVIGSRPIKDHHEFSLVKKFFQVLGSQVVRIFSNSKVEDAPSGFRAYSRFAAKKINIFSNYTYTLESIIQAGQSGLIIQSIPIRVNLKTRESRLFKSNFQYIRRSINTIIRSFAIYRPFRFFGLGGLFFLIIGAIPLIRFGYFYLFESAAGHIQSLIFGGLFFLIGFILIIFSFISELISINRQLLEKILEKISE